MLRMVTSDDMRATASRKEVDLQDIVSRVGKELEEKESLQGTVQVLKAEISRSTDAKMKEIELIKSEQSRIADDKESRLSHKHKELEAVLKELESARDTVRDRDMQILKLKNETVGLNDKCSEYEDKLERQEDVTAQHHRRCVQLKRDLEEAKESHENQQKVLSKRHKEDVEQYEESVNRLNSKIKVLETQLTGSESKNQMHEDELAAAKREVQEFTIHHKASLEKQSALQSENTKLHVEL